MLAQRQELWGVQILRAVAAVAVLVHHALEESNGAVGRFSPDWLTTSGASGVDIFFLISGFIMVYTCFSGASVPTAGTFLTRRTLRIYPFYWLCILAKLAIVGAGFLSSTDLSTSTLVASFLLLPSENKIMGVSWTLVYEMYFYLIFAISLQFRSPKIALALTTSLIALVFVSAQFTGAGTFHDFFTNPIVFEFCLGMALGLVFITRGSVPIAPWVGLVAMAVLFVAPLISVPPRTAGLVGFDRVLLWGVPSMILLAAALNIAKPRGQIGRAALLLGDASYALYLTHNFVMIAYAFLIKKGVFGDISQLLILPFVIAIAIAVSIAAHLWVEKPVTRLVRRMTHPAKTPERASP